MQFKELDPRLNSAIAWINEEYNQINNLDKIYDGVNSSIYKIICEDKKLSIKLYKKNKNLEFRINREIEILKIMNKSYDIKVPKLLAFDKKYGWIINDFIEGEQPSNYNKLIINEMFNFMNVGQNLYSTYRSKKIIEAAEACFNFNDFVDILKSRLKKLEKINSKKIDFIYHELLSKEFKYLQKYIEKECDPEELNNLVSFLGKTISQSDIGLHNLIFNKKTNYLYFVDFEHAGLDSLMKGLIDMLIQPENLMPKELILFFVEKINILSNNKITTIDDLKPFLYIQRLKWCIIITNPLLYDKNLSSKKIFEKIKKYISLTNNLFNLY